MNNPVTITNKDNYYDLMVKVGVMVYVIKPGEKIQIDINQWSEIYFEPDRPRPQKVK
ncbi:MAG: hypothetical protein V3U02_12550 [Calditrichia bacterium]